MTTVRTGCGARSTPTSCSPWHRAPHRTCLPARLGRSPGWRSPPRHRGCRRLRGRHGGTARGDPHLGGPRLARLGRLRTAGARRAARGVVGGPSSTPVPGGGASSWSTPRSACCAPVASPRSRTAARLRRSDRWRTLDRGRTLIAGRSTTDQGASSLRSTANWKVVAAGVRALVAVGERVALVGDGSRDAGTSRSARPGRRSRAARGWMPQSGGRTSPAADAPWPRPPPWAVGSTANIPSTLVPALSGSGQLAHATIDPAMSGSSSPRATSTVDRSDHLRTIAGIGAGRPTGWGLGRPRRVRSAALVGGVDQGDSPSTSSGSATRIRRAPRWTVETRPGIDGSELEHPELRGR